MLSILRQDNRAAAAVGTDHRPSRARRAAAWLVDRRGPTWPEILGFVVLVGGLTLLLLWDHIHRAGWYADDYYYRQFWTRFDGQGLWAQFKAMENMKLLQGRPGLAAYMSFTHAVLGDQPRAHLAWAALLAVPFSTVVYLLLRVLRFRPLEAGVVGLLLLVFPGSDSTRIWSIISDAQVAMSFALAGVTCSVVSMGMEAGRRRIALRAVGVLLVIGGVLVYEITWAPLAFAFLLYRTRTTWRTALRQAVLDWAVLGLVYLLVLRNGFFEPQPLHTSIDHAWEIFKQSLTFFSQHVLLFHNTALPLVLAGLVVVASAIAVWRLPAGHATRAALLRWLAVLGCAVLLTAAAYVMYATATSYYLPLAPGYMNRTNAFAAVPLIVAALACLELLFAVLSLASRSLSDSDRGPGLVSAAAVLVAALALGVTYTKDIAQDLKLWDSAYARAYRTISAFQAQVPSFDGIKRPFVVFYGQPLEEAPGIPVWEFNYDLQGAMQIRYDGDRAIRARPAFPGAKITCNAHDLKFEGIYALRSDGGAYGTVWLFDAVNQKVYRPRDQRDCQAADAALVPGPWVAEDPGSQAR